MKRLVMDPKFKTSSILMSKDEEIKCIKCGEKIRAKGWVAFNPCYTELVLCQECHKTFPFYMFYIARDKHPRLLYEFEEAEFDIKHIEEEEKIVDDFDDLGELFITTSLWR